MVLFFQSFRYALYFQMVASKFLHDDGEVDEVFNDEWAASAGFNVKDINNFERDFLQAIVSTIPVQIFYLTFDYETHCLGAVM
jgi:hypothetical protein